MARPWVVILAFLAGCAADPTPPADPVTHPSDTACELTWHADGDGDSFGDPATATQGCVAPAGYVANELDCADDNASIHPGAPESCTLPVDANCDGSIGYADADLDAAPACEDCDDGDATVKPGLAELCDSVDNDCDGGVDEDPVDGDAWYADADGDGYGDVTTVLIACVAPAGHVAAVHDCDEGDPDVSPAAIERCDGVDNDCDGATDDATAVDAVAWWEDADRDGWGLGASTSACEPPPGSAAQVGDCDDLEPAANPGQTELCNGMDDNCDGTTDGSDAADAWIYYEDLDLDGWGSASVYACSEPAGYGVFGGDCDESTVDVHPEQPEACNGVDDDCDGNVDEADAFDAPTWYQDSDGDGFGDRAHPEDACASPAGSVANATDCDDGAASVNPSAREVCNGVDDDCEGTADDDAIDVSLWAQDADSDGYGDISVTHVSCVAPTGFVADTTDCDDARASTSPAAAERCNGLDDDCDGDVDIGAVDAEEWYADDDGDAAGGLLLATECSGPTGAVSIGGDCDDTDPLVYPGATESCVDDIDANCDGLSGTEDHDGDGWAACDDCDDTSVDVSPDEVELCDGVDGDCDGTTDIDAVDAGYWYTDTDGDGFGATAALACTASPDEVATGGDCDDGDGSVNPGAVDSCATAADDDCDGDVIEVDAADCTRWYLDDDGDGHGSTSWLCACVGSEGFTASDDEDCDDDDPERSPDVGDTFGDGVDDNCDGEVDAEVLGADGLWGESGDSLGRRLAMADLNGDGLADLVASAEDNSEGADHAGAAFVLFGGQSGQIGQADADVRILGDASYDYAGASVATGDLDGDGVAELLVTAHLSDLTGGGAGLASVFSGPVSSGTVSMSDADWMIGGATGDALGRGVFINDSDGDGRAELLLGTPWNDAEANFAGAAWLLQDVPTGVNTVALATTTLWGGSERDVAGYGLADAGDTNGDGLTDVLIGAGGESTLAPDAGAAYVLEGPLSTGVLEDVATATWLGEFEDAGVGYTLSCAGDLDADGYTDMLVPGTSRSYIAFGPHSGTRSLGDADVTVLAPFVGDILAADLDQDGEVEIVVSEPDDATCSANNGAVRVLPVSIRGTVESNDVATRVLCGTPSSWAGAALAAGDMDGDALLEIAISTYVESVLLAPGR